VARLADRSAGSVTEVGMIVGTPAYMAPEQLLAEAVDARTDLYAAGVVLYECLTGRLPFEAATPVAMIAKQMSATPAAPVELNPAVPATLSGLVLRALARDPAERPGSAAELLALLREVR